MIDLDRPIWRDYLANCWPANTVALVFSVGILVLLVVTQSASGLGYLGGGVWCALVATLVILGIWEDRR